MDEDRPTRAYLAKTNSRIRFLQILTQVLLYVYCDLLMQGQRISNSAHCQVTHLLLYNSSCLKLAYPKRKIEKLRRIVSCRARHDAVPSCSSHPIASFLQWQCLGPFLLKQHHFIILLSLNSHNFFHVKCISSHVNRL